MGFFLEPDCSSRGSEIQRRLEPRVQTENLKILTCPKKLQNRQQQQQKRIRFPLKALNFNCRILYSVSHDSQPPFLPFSCSLSCWEACLNPSLGGGLIGTNALENFSGNPFSTFPSFPAVLSI